jgi:hypothetical protein
MAISSRKEDKSKGFEESAHAPVFNIAKWVITFSFSVIGALGIVAILAVAFGDEKKVSAIKDILSILLPVIGAWAGTVIAYYFSRENFESAAKNTRSLVKELSPDKVLESILIKDAMIPIETASKLELTKNESEIYLKPDLIDSIMDKNKKNRLPILDKEGKIKYMLHRSIIDQFIVNAVSAGKALKEISLQDLLADDEFKKIVLESFETLGPNSNLAEAKALMDKVVNCSDVFVTENGKRDSKAVGWVTNAIVLSHSSL